MTEPTTEAIVVDFPKKALVKKVGKYVLCTGAIVGGVLVALNYKARDFEDVIDRAEELVRMEETEKE